MDESVELEACVLIVWGIFVVLGPSLFLRLPSLVEDSVAADLCLGGFSSDL